jgi:hypothetical protein
VSPEIETGTSIFRIENGFSSGDVIQGDAIVFRQKLKINDAPEVVALKCALALEELARQRYELPGFSTLTRPRSVCFLPESLPPSDFVRIVLAGRFRLINANRR